MMTKETWARLIFSGIFFLAITSFLFGCAATETITRISASIMEENSGWKVKTHRRTIVGVSDILQGENLKILLSFRYDEKSGSYHLRIMSNDIDKPVEFSPSHITLKIPDQNQLRVKALNCNYEEIAEPITMSPVKRNHIGGKFCYALFFDKSASVKDKEVVVLLNNALKSESGDSINVPPIHFRETTERYFQFGLVE